MSIATLMYNQLQILIDDLTIPVESLTASEIDSYVAMETSPSLANPLARRYVPLPESTWAAYYLVSGPERKASIAAFETFVRQMHL
jgi:hypothetical protein